MYTIAKHATEKDWGFYWEHNPQEGIHSSQSAYFTKIGTTVNIKLSYESVEEAQCDLDKIIDLNPSGNYAICKLIDS